MAEEPDKPYINGTNDTNDDNDNVSSATTSAPAKPRAYSIDPDAQEMVIASLRTQIQDLFSQVNELNNKLVKSYDRVSDLEDDIHVTSANLRTSSIRISQLELERTQHLAALNTGLLVEKSHVTTELNRLMEKATEEAAQRGQAESARAAIEKDLDDLSATLFDQANTMVAEARFARHLSEQKVSDAQRALKGAEEAVSIMQTQMQQLRAEKEESERKAHEIQVKMGKGKWLERIQTVDLSRPLKLKSSHLPYQEFLIFVAHLRSLHQTSPQPPAMPTILPLPFLARLSNEDSDPTIRLDLAPSLNWLSRRSVLNAVHTGQLTIEPIPISSLFSETTLYSSPVTVAGMSANNDTVSCALCGAAITTVAEHFYQRSRRSSSISNHHTNNTSWSGSFFKKTANRATSIISNGSSRPPSPTHSISPPAISASSSQGNTQQVYIFRVATAPMAASISSIPLPSIAKSLSQSGLSASSTPYHTAAQSTPIHTTTSSPNNQPITLYPLCSSGWCLKRLRSTCTLWAFVRTGIVEKIWEEEIPVLPTTPTSTSPVAKPETKPPIPPRKRGLWGLASAISERAVSWSDSDKDKKKPEMATPTATTAKPNPANRVPVSSQPPPLPPRARRVSVPRKPPPSLQTETKEPAVNAVPPPIPKRSEGRRTSPRKKSIALGDGTDSNPTTPTKLVFDAGEPQSPLQTVKTLPAEDSSTTVATLTDGSTKIGTDTTTGDTTEKPKETEEGGPQTSPVVPLRPNRFSLPRNIPLPDSRPNTPTMNTNGSDGPPERNGSPATPTGTAPPPVPRRAAARRPPPSVPENVQQSRPSTPLKVEAKPFEPPAGPTEEKKEQVSAKTEEEPAVNGKDNNEAALKNSVEKTPESEEETLKEEDTADDVKPATNGPVDIVKVEATQDAPQKSPASDKDVFVDAPSSVPPKDNAETNISDEDLKTATQNSFNKQDSKAVNGVATVNETKAELIESPTTEHGASEESGEADPEDKEIYIGDATWEERTWKHIVRLREEMYWARIGGTR
ncbi:hypothetical protein FA15DRAFT_703121 [Coprinopsis marcescibilis]|uniref:GDP/GTP exchange factor Sec2 N-terminal domain-containing protein n=1 Tax=Coprinopsis marcescibilis TaxID=230819 RepID=A0A5C3L0E7_COPMA|nr:hypothetical protein FA15DRAFT_703121 [Coprinopsis marcescibilis]